jgi:hypothetical protein
MGQRRCRQSSSFWLTESSWCRLCSQIHKTVHQIRRDGVKAVALQMPEGLMIYGCLIGDILERCVCVFLLRACKRVHTDLPLAPSPLLQVHRRSSDPSGCEQRPAVHT